LAKLVYNNTSRSKYNQDLTMIPRYSRPEMQAIWSDESKYAIWLDIELHACDALAKIGLIPQEAAQVIRQKARFDIDEINTIERETKHDVIAFLTSVANSVGEEARFIHQGMTSSDVLDTAYAVQMKRAADMIIDDIDNLLAALKKRAEEHKYTATIGRSHGIHAEPVTFGLKLAGFYAEFNRARTRMMAARDEIATCKISGAVGTYAHIDSVVERHVAESMGLSPEDHSTQVIPRDRHAMFFAVLGVVASSVERLAIEIRHLQRTELREVEEYFSPGQKGSSAMPHKRNPVLTENLTGLARIVRAAVTPALENVALWHERDISHSSVERVFGPDATIALDFALHRLAAVMENLVVYPDRMQANLDALGGLVHSQQVLLALTQGGISREEAYKIVQRNAMETWKNGGSFLDRLKADKAIGSCLSADDLDALFNLDQHFARIDMIFDRVFK
jgi:adenylosuccinate lyase